MRSFEERGLRHDLVEAGGMGPSQSLRVGVVRVPEDGHIRVVVRDVGRIDPRDVRDHEIGWLDPIGRLEAMLRQERLELAPDEEVDPAQEDRCHA